MINEIFSEWNEEVKSSLLENTSLCVALVGVDGKLLFANKAMQALFTDDFVRSLINPTFDRLLELNPKGTVVYDGFITLGDYSSINTSLLAQVYRKGDKFLIMGGVDVDQLVVQNRNLHHLNREVSNLQRELIKEKHTLEYTLNKLNEANHELEELIATKDKLFSIIAHDLKNPFTAIFGFSELLSKNISNYPPERVKEFSNSIYSSSKQAYTLLENLLEWSRLQTGKLKSVPMVLKPSEVIGEVVGLIADFADSKQIALKTHIQYDGPVWADKEMLKTILRNLLSNALKFTYPGGVVEIETHLNEDQVLFVVSDNGMGINEDFIDQIFHVESKLSERGTSDEKGTGLGLILCKEFVEDQNGKIWVESEFGKGTDFKFTLPVKGA